MPSKSKPVAAKPKAPSRPAKAAPRRPVGRPSLYTPELADLICERVAEGESLRKICADDDMPHRSNVERWLSQDPDFAAKYAHARERQGDLMDEEQMEICRQIKTKEIAAAEARVLVGVLQWRASKLAPKRYGEKIDVSHSGGIDVSDTSLDARIASLGASIFAAIGQGAASRTAEPD